jgi:hypothetical protein
LDKDEPDWESSSQNECDIPVDSASGMPDKVAIP